MNKLSKSFLVLILLGLTGCGSNEAPSVITEEVGYHFMIDDISLSLGDQIEETVDLISEQASYFEAPSCAFVGTDYIYTYNDYSATFALVDDVKQLVSLTLTSDLVETSEGIYLGQSFDDITAVYGNDYEGDASALSYYKGNSELKFILDEDKIISIILQVKQ